MDKLSLPPLFQWGICFLLGCAWVVHPALIYACPLALLLLFCPKRLSTLLLFALGLGWTYFLLPDPLPQNCHGKVLFCLEKIQPIKSPFYNSLCLRGTLKLEGKSYTCSLLQNRLPKTGTAWEMEGTLQEKGPYQYVFKPKKGEWKEVEDSFSFARLRYGNKERVRRYFHRKIADKKTAHFFASMATGDPDDWLLTMEFRKVGLGHILAISGFHFALLAAFIGTILRLFLSPKIAYSILFFAMAGYFLFLGGSPSVLRAFTMINLYILGLLLHRRIDSLNLLGGALLFELVLDPFSLLQAGFQLSFLATGGILLFYSFFHKQLAKLFPIRTLRESSGLSFIDQHGHLLSSFLRKAIALNLSVQATTLLPTLLLFGSFPLLSLPYNLLFPPLLGLSMLLLLFPPLLQLNAVYTSLLLKIIGNPPELIHFKIFTTPSFSLVVLLLTVILGFGLTKRGQTS